MTFEEQILATLIGTACGAVLGFIFAIIGFRINEKLQIKSELLNIINNLKSEFEINQVILAGRVHVINEYIETIEDNDIFAFHNFKRYERIILDSLFVKGRIYDIFDTYEFADIYRILNIINEYTEDNIDNRVRGSDSEANVNYLNEAKDEFIVAYERLKKLIVSLDKKKIKTENTSILYYLKGS
jgi:hypothetical protein